jgi:predicted nucleic acid-binding protein
VTAIAVDSNVLVALMVDEAPASHVIRSAVRGRMAAGDTFITPVFCLGEFWRVTTEPRGAGRPPERALAFLRGWLRRARLVQPDRRFESVFLRELEDRQPRGADVFDIAIGVLARQRGAAELWTADLRFPELDGLRVVNPASLH